ncbi:MAG: nucleotide exchange factor GrpE [Clostridiales bacterium]|jgi:molecular chaperone GrpE|nr:nucleotide exchange factor GrpE [Clostridiales bacterium]
MAKKKPEVNETPITQPVGDVSELEKLKDELNTAESNLLRLAAEYDNFRKRTQKEKEQSYSDAKAMIINELLPVIDNFDRAIDNADCDIESYKKGIEMTYNQLLSVFSSLGVESFGKTGDDFDPAFHNAIMHKECDELPESTLSEVFKKGYKIGDKVIRCADVQVAN